MATMICASLIAFFIILAFLIGLYAMYRISEHYNSRLRDYLERREDPFFDVREVEQKPQRAAQKPKPRTTQQSKDGAECQSKKST